MKKFKRTAGQRRYLALKKKADNVRWSLEGLQSDMLSVAKNNGQLTQISIMQKITQAVERLK